MTTAESRPCPLCGATLNWAFVWVKDGLGSQSCRPWERTTEQQRTHDLHARAMQHLIVRP